MIGLEFPTEEARKKYLQEHPKADPKKHTVRGKPTSTPKSDKSDFASTVYDWENRPKVNGEPEAISNKNLGDLIPQLQKLTLPNGRMQETLRYIDKALRNGREPLKGMVFVLRDGKDISGWAAVEPTNSGVRVDTFVSPKHRGKGVGKKLLTQAKGFADDMGAPLRADYHDQASKKLYESVPGVEMHEEKA